MIAASLLAGVLPGSINALAAAELYTDPKELAPLPANASIKACPVVCIVAYVLTKQCSSNVYR